VLLVYYILDKTGKTLAAVAVFYQSKGAALREDLRIVGQKRAAPCRSSGLRRVRDPRICRRLRLDFNERYRRPALHASS